jgi:RNA polymerase-binding transcription factor DksA
MEQPEIDAAERDVDDIEKALERLDAGTHGTCEVCGKPIPADVLAASPTTRTCAEHTS